MVVLLSVPLHHPPHGHHHPPQHRDDGTGNKAEKKPKQFIFVRGK